MNSSPTRYRLAAPILYIVGAVIGVLIAGSAIASDLEAQYYGFVDLSRGHFNSLSCPAILTQKETGQIRAKIQNPLDRDIQQLVRIDISTPGMVQSSRSQIVLQPGESQTLEWPVDRANIDLGNFIFAKVYLYPQYPVELREATCGILVLNLPFLKGSQVYFLGIVLSLAGLAGGLILWIQGSRPISGRRREITYAMISLAVLITLAILCAVMSWWLLGAIVIVLCVLLSMTMLFLFL